jgi:hypothetical protein
MLQTWVTVAMVVVLWMSEKGEKEANDSLKSIRLVKFGDEISSITLTNRLSNPH